MYTTTRCVALSAMAQAPPNNNQLESNDDKVFWQLPLKQWTIWSLLFLQVAVYYLGSSDNEWSSIAKKATWTNMAPITKQWWSTATKTSTTFVDDNNQHVDPNSIYVPGGGMSGYWYMLGQLQAIKDPKSKDYYCYSAGCLGVASAIFYNNTVDEMMDLAYYMRDQYMSGNVSRADFVTECVRGLHGTHEAKRKRRASTMNVDMLSRIHIITSTPGQEGSMRMQTSIRVPKTIQELQEMLVETTWIPYAFGETLWHTNSQTGVRHMDGGFTHFNHPKCARSLTSPWSWDLIWNTLNIGLERKMAKSLWTAGYNSVS